MIALVRHGETAGNASGVIQLPDTPLSARGHVQAQRLAGRLAGLGVGGILASDYARARMTAEPVARACGTAPVLEPLLRERDFGALRGRAYAELGFDPFAAEYVPPGGESWARFRARVARAWARVAAVAAATEGTLAVVTHGLVCHVLADAHLQLAPGTAPSRGFGNASLTLVEADAPHRVQLLDCTAHLA